MSDKEEDLGFDIDPDTEEPYLGKVVKEPKNPRKQIKRLTRKQRNEVAPFMRRAADMLDGGTGSYAREVSIVHAIADEGEKGSQADRLVGYVLKNTILFHDKLGDGYVKCTNSAPAIYKLRSSSFKTWAAKTFYDKEERTPNAEAISSAIMVLEGKACFDAPMYELYNRAAPDPQGNGFWYDLSDKENRTIHITKEGWSIENEPPILFRRYKHQIPQTLPERNGDPRLFLNFANIKDEDKDLKLVDLHTKFIPDIPHTIWLLYGPQGAAKTTTMEFERSIIDPSAMKTLVIHYDTKELAQQLEHNWCAYFDNISSDKNGETSIPRHVTEMLSRAATGAGFPKRGLYTDDEDVILDFMRNVAINGINLAATKPDILDRALLTEVEAIQNKDRKPIKTIRADFEKQKGRILGGIFDTLAKAIKIYPTIKFNSLPRMADYAVWGCAIAEALELGNENKQKSIAEAENPEDKKAAEKMKTGAERFLELYATNVERQVEEATKSSIVASVLLPFLADSEAGALTLPVEDDRKCLFDGTANDLLDKLEDFAEAHRIRIKDETFPKTANALSRKLNDIKTNLLALNYELIKTRGHAGRSLKINKIIPPPLKLGENTVTIVTSTQPASDQVPPSDDKRDDKENAATDADTSRPASTQAGVDSDDNDDVSTLLGEEISLTHTCGSVIVEPPQGTEDDIVTVVCAGCHQDVQLRKACPTGWKFLSGATSESKTIKFHCIACDKGDIQVDGDVVGQPRECPYCGSQQLERERR